VTQEKIPAQVDVICRICEMRASEVSFGRIARTMKAGGIVPPAHPHTNREPAWYASTIKQITNNELYRGWRVWNRTQNAFNRPEGKKGVRKRPPSAANASSNRSTNLLRLSQLISRLEFPHPLKSMRFSFVLLPAGDISVGVRLASGISLVVRISNRSLSLFSERVARGTR
jgi:Recombinase